MLGSERKKKILMHQSNKDINELRNDEKIL